MSKIDEEMTTCIYNDSRQEQGFVTFTNVPAIALYDFQHQSFPQPTNGYMVTGGPCCDFDYIEHCEEEQYIIWSNAQTINLQSDGEFIQQQIKDNRLDEITSENNNVLAHHHMEKPLSQDGEVSTSTDAKRLSKHNQKKPPKPSSIRRSNKKTSSSSNRKRKSSYKHVAHAEKPPHLVAKRNARERNRVHAVNLAFVRLRKAIPLENKRGKRVSKVKVLQKAISYIRNLHDIIGEHDGLPPLQENDVGQSLDDSHLFAF